MQVAGHIAGDLQVGIADVYRDEARALGTAWHAVAAATRGAVHAVTKWSKAAYHASVHAVKTAAHAVAKAASATAPFVKHHAAAIASIVVSTAVFIGCDAALGAPTLGVGAVAYVMPTRPALTGPGPCTSR